ncbi:WXG100 family type VII secretion target [Mobilisporobacter senegalensis]|uniref:WXG100 family type VII secretion target n=1 Tax=Mobilisporobacter senegalensis TaxID=1329262 RepID=A0A3N1XZT6_9FIRM|nr:WXG100 family type VII secretion target [Mobilisporobacter senegalensis]ROR31761.1 WXG100 family type VII secretion target [Mobilisporobacter senegalensis]
MSESSIRMELETKYLEDANKDFLKTLKSLEDIKKDIEDNVNLLYDVWVGKSRNEFERQYNLLFSKISDIKDSLDEIYNMMVAAQTSYDETDDDIRQKIAMGSQQS